MFKQYGKKVERGGKLRGQKGDLTWKNGSLSLTNEHRGKKELKQRREETRFSPRKLSLIGSENKIIFTSEFKNGGQPKIARVSSEQ